MMVMLSRTAKATTRRKPTTAPAEGLSTALRLFIGPSFSLRLEPAVVARGADVVISPVRWSLVALPTEFLVVISDRLIGEVLRMIVAIHGRYPSRLVPNVQTQTVQ
jgi:hypothetical protein